MRMKARNVLLLAHAAAFLLGCNAAYGPPVGSGNCRTSEVLPDSSLALSACAVRDSVSRGEHVPIFVALTNGGPPVKVRARLMLGVTLGADVVGPDGIHARPQYPGSWEPGFIGPDTTDIVLPRSTMFGRVIELDCGSSDYSEDASRECVPLFKFTAAGSYTIHVRYVMQCAEPPCPNGFPWTGRLDARPFSVVVK
jgi:hypothetical protein